MTLKSHPTTDFTIKEILPGDQGDVISLLLNVGLPVADISFEQTYFIGCYNGRELIGCGAVEHHGACGLLRSVAIHGGYRSLQLGKKIVQFIERKVAETGISDLILLTENADRYFSKLGYSVLPRKDVPPEITQTSQYSAVCPETAIVMIKKL